MSRRKSWKRSRFSLTRLESREVPAAFSVTSTANSGGGTLRQAVLDANANGTGLDTITFNIPFASTIVLTGEISVTGSLIIDGSDSIDFTVSGNNANRIFNIGNATAALDVSLLNLDLTAGKAVGGDGGAVSNSGENLTVENCYVHFNTASGLGGALFSSGPLTVTNSIITGNSAANGGAIAIYNGSIDLSTSQVRYNTSKDAGGGLWLFADGSNTLTNTNFEGNSAKDGGHIASGIYGGSLTIAGCSLINGSASNRGGALSHFSFGPGSSGAITVVDSGVTGNKGNAGGGFYFTGPDPGASFTLRNSSIAGNTADSGGGICQAYTSAPLVLQNCTVSGNSGTGQGGGLFHYGAGSIALESTILSNNSSPQGPDALTFAATLSYKNSAIGDIGGITNPNDQGGNLAPATNLKLGAPDLFGFVRPANDSPVIDKGSNPAGLAFDGRGISRVWGTAIDIGAVEVPVATNVLNDNDSGPGSLRRLITDSNFDDGGASAAASTINFDPIFFATAKAINVDAGEMAIFDAVVINGPGFDKVILNANGKSRIFNTSNAADGTSITFAGMTMTKGLSAGGGGAIYIGQEVVTISNCVVSNSSAGSDGGGIYVHSLDGVGSLARLVLDGSTVSGNTASSDGGGIYFYNGGSFLLRNSSIIGNKASATGGGLYFYGPASAGGIALSQVTLSGNSAGSTGGAVVLRGGTGAGTLLVHSSTVVENTASSGGGISRDAGAFAIDVQSSIVSGNTGTSPDINSTGTVTAKFSAIGSNTGFTLTDQGNNLPFQPHANLLLGPIIATGTASGFIHAPGILSPLVDAGSNPTGSTTDLRGEFRTIGVQPDIGDFEVRNFIVLTTANAGPGSLRQTLEHANSIPGPNTVTFDPTVFATAQTITLTSPLTITDEMTVNGPGARRVTVDGQSAVQILMVDGVAPGNAVTLSGMTLANGFSFTGGGAIMNIDAAITISECTLKANSAINGGGAIASGLGAVSLTIVGSTLSNNTTNGSGGAIVNPAGAVVIRNSTLTGNSAGNSGLAGGAVATVAQLTVENSTIVGNMAQGAAGLFGGSTVTVTSSIVSGNTATGAGTDVYAFNTVAGTSAIGSSMVVNSFTDQGGNILNQPHASLKLRDLADNGGPVDTMAPLFDSPLLNVGSNPASLTTDARGQARDNGGVDMGAFELHTYATSSKDDGGIGQIRAALADADRIAGPDTVSFGPLFATLQVIGLNGELSINSAVTIDGPASQTVKLFGFNLNRLVNTSGAPTGTAILFNNMFMSDGKSDDGGLMFIGDESVTLFNTSIEAGTATDDGGAIFVAGSGTLSLDNSTTSNSTAGGSGGGVYLGTGATLSTISSTIAKNSSGGNGGGVYFFNGGSLTVVNSTISGNKALQTSATVGGGGIYFYGTASEFLIANSTISGNSAVRTIGASAPYGYGGGVMLNSFSGENFIENTTITGNDAGRLGGGVAQASGTTRFRSVLIAGNKILGADAATADVFFLDATTVSLDHNFIGINDPATNATFGAQTQTGTLATPLDAKLGPLQNNGGPTFTHALLAGSPAINKGNNGDGLAVDQRGPGFARVVGGQADVGAFEVQTVAPPPTATVKIDSGTGQRSMIQSLVITFSEPVVFTGAAAAAIQLERLATSTNPTPNGFVTLAFSPAAGPANSFTITFNDPTFAPTVGSAKSLIDGKYQLVLNASQIKSASSGSFLDGDGNGTGGDNQATNFHRLFGDVRGSSTADFNGNGFTDNIDLIAFRNANGSDTSSPNYDPALDVNGDGFIDNVDFLAFRQRLGTSP